MLPLQARVELIDFYDFLLNKYAPFKAVLAKDVPTKPLRLGSLAVELFGTTAGIPRHPPHKPLELGQ